MFLPQEVLAVLSGLASAASWGAGDFSGGMATRKGNVYSVVILSEIVGLFFLLLVALLSGETLPPSAYLLWAAVAGVSGTLGLTGLYQAMAIGQMGVAAPVSAVLAASIPVVAGSILEGLPGRLKIVGFGLGLVGLWLISRAEAAHGTRTGFRLALLAGFGFAGYYIMIDQATRTSLFWPLVFARFLSTLVIFLIARAMRQPWQSTRPAAPWIIAAGICDVGGNVFFALGTQLGRLDISAVMVSAAPMFTILLALLVVKERLTRWQIAGIALMLVAIVLFAIKEAPL
jgi:drug/metabolite transporter (DMT)-like permease